MPEVIGLSIMFTCFYDSAYELANNIKRFFPKIIIIAGGAHITTLYKHALDNSSIDYCLRYEGEVSFPKLIKKLLAHEKPYDVPGIAFRDQQHPNDFSMMGNAIYSNQQIEWITNLDAWKPAYDLFDYALYDNTVTLITSRGCPYSCSFCTVHLSMGRQFRSRSVTSVVNEIEHYYSLRVKNFNIEDDNFTLDMSRAVSLFEAIIQKNIKGNFFLLNGIIAKKMMKKIYGYLLMLE